MFCFFKKKSFKLQPLSKNVSLNVSLYVCVCACVCVRAGKRQAITSANLGAVTNEDGNEISYSLIRPPRLGRLIQASDKNQYEEISQFSQTQVPTFSACAILSAFFSGVILLDSFSFVFHHPLPRFMSHINAHDQNKKRKPDSFSSI